MNLNELKATVFRVIEKKGPLKGDPESVIKGLRASFINDADNRLERKIRIKQSQLIFHPFNGMFFTQSKEQIEENFKQASMITEEDIEEDEKEDRKKVPIIYEGLHYSFIPDGLFSAGKKISNSEVRYWLILRKFAQDKTRIAEAKTWPHQKTIAKLMGSTEAWISKIEKKLIQKGLLEKRSRGLGRSHLRILKDPSEWIRQNMTGDFKKYR